MTHPRSQVFLFALLAVVLSPVSLTAELHESLADLEPLLGTWQVSSSPEIRVEYKAALGGRFVESLRWLSQDQQGRLVAHSMIGSDVGSGDLVEYRFDASGRLQILDFEPSSMAEKTRLESAAPTASSGSSLDPSLEHLRPFLGQWEVTTDWFDGGLLWAMMSNSAELDGQVIVSKVLAAEGGKAAYDRYRSFYLRGETKPEQEITFTYRGRVVREEFAAEVGSGGLVMTSTYAPGSLSKAGIIKRLTFETPGRMDWLDRVRSEGTSEWTDLIDASWIRIGSGDSSRQTRPIDDRLFVASGSELNSLMLERVMDGTVGEIWEAWTTADAWQAVYAPDSAEVRAEIALAIGGKYEWLFDGEVGGNGCQILSFIPHRMLSFSWNAPVAQTRSRTARTWVVVETTPNDEHTTHVRLTHLGFGSEAHWQETRSYFESAWAYVLDTMAANFAARDKNAQAAESSAM